MALECTVRATVCVSALACAFGASSRQLTWMTIKTSLRRALRLVAVGVVTAIGSYLYLSSAGGCETDVRAMKGEAKRTDDGRMLYFDGRCWTSAPTPPRDTPY
jgi:hypothetical protein